MSHRHAEDGGALTGKWRRECRRVFSVARRSRLAAPEAEWEERTKGQRLLQMRATWFTPTLKP